MTTSLSNLIKRDDHNNIKIEAFPVQEIEADSVSGGGSSGRGHSGGPEDHISKIEREAYEKGFSQGQKDGFALGKKRLEETAKRLEALIENLSELKSRLYRESEEEILRLSIEIARKIVQRELSLDGEAVLRTIRKAVDFLNERTSIKVLVNPADMEKVKETLPELRTGKKIENIELIEDPSVARGGCILQTGFGTINATIEDQLAAIAEELEDELGNNGHTNASIT